MTLRTFRVASTWRPSSTVAAEAASRPSARRISVVLAARAGASSTMCTSRQLVSGSGIPLIALTVIRPVGDTRAQVLYHSERLHFLLRESVLGLGVTPSRLFPGIQSRNGCFVIFGMSLRGQRVPGGYGTLRAAVHCSPGAAALCA